VTSFGRVTHALQAADTSLGSQQFCSGESGVFVVVDMLVGLEASRLHDPSRSGRPQPLFVTQTKGG
jgi:hypothetical protein